MMAKSNGDLVVEWAAFTLRESVDEETLLAASTRLTDQFLAQQDGFVRLELLKGEGRTWVDLVYWRDRKAAEAAIRKAGDNPACGAFFSLLEMDDPSEAEEGPPLFAQKAVWAEGL